MTYIINAIAWIVDFLLSKKTRFIAFLPLKVAVYSLTSLAVTLYIAAFIAFGAFLLKIVNLLYSLLDQANNVNIGSGEAYGVTLVSIWHAFIGFMYASGIGEAFMTALNLFLSLLFMLYAVRISITVSRVFMEVSNLLTNSLRAIEG